MAYAIELDDGTIIEVPDLASDRRNWKTYCDYILHVAALKNVVQQYDGTDAKPVDVMQHEFKAWEQRNKMAKLLISLTIPDSLLMCVMHLETAHEWFKHLADQFETKTSDVTQWEASCNPRRRVTTHQKHSKDARKLQECEATMNKPEIAKVTEPRDSTHREWKRDEAAAREPGKEAVDAMTRSISLAVTPSSQDDDSRDMGVPCTRVTPREPQSTSPVANDPAADAVNPNATSARPPEPAGTSHDLRDEPHESTGSYPGTRGENDDSRGPGTHCTHVTAQRPQAATGEASADATNPNVTSVGPPEPVGASREPPDEPADGVSLAPPASSPHEEPAASAPPSVPLEGERESETIRRRTSHATVHAPSEGESTANEMTDDVSLAAPASSPVKAGVATPTDNTTNVSSSETATPPSILLEGEHDAQQHTNGTRTGHQHGTNVHGEGPSAWAERHASCTTNSGPRVPDRIVEDPSGRTEPSTSGTPLSIPLEGEHPSNGHADDEPAARVCQVQVEDQQTDRPRGDIPEPCTPPAKRPKRRTKRANPPRRRRRLKSRSDSSPGTSETHQRCWGSTLGPPGPNPKDSKPGTRRLCIPITRICKRATNYQIGQPHGRSAQSLLGHTLIYGLEELHSFYWNFLIGAVWWRCTLAVHSGVATRRQTIPLPLERRTRGCSGLVGGLVRGCLHSVLIRAARGDCKAYAVSRLVHGALASLAVVSSCGLSVGLLAGAARLMLSPHHPLTLLVPSLNSFVDSLGHSACVVAVRYLVRLDLRFGRSTHWLCGPGARHAWISAAASPALLLVIWGSWSTMGVEWTPVSLPSSSSLLGIMARPMLLAFRSMAPSPGPLAAAPCSLIHPATLLPSLPLILTLPWLLASHFGS
ncbi:hypothetical protein BU15DRAFT_79079 [Melanogaster broomeanus]|nr:hypothetical protein BU15DRAFT_79079 [Melanogaster broomeanus]